VSGDRRKRTLQNILSNNLESKEYLIKDNINTADNEIIITLSQKMKNFTVHDNTLNNCNNKKINNDAVIIKLTQKLESCNLCDNSLSTCKLNINDNDNKVFIEIPLSLKKKHLSLNQSKKLPSTYWSRQRRI
jgi:hypothetical protein